MKRGFKTMAKELALEVRREIDLGADVPFEPHALAKLYGIQVLRISDLGLSATESTAFSGALIATGTGQLIVENDSHSPARCKMTVSHEMSHVVLEHSFSTLIVDSAGCRDLIGDQEGEAAFLAGELVLPSDAAIQLAFRNATDEEVALHFGISVEAARWRMNVSGARVIASRARAKRAS